MGTETVILAKPLTFMNRSGGAVSRLFEHAKIVDPSDLVVIHDDLDLPFGTIRIKSGGGHGGHRGLESIIMEMGSGDFTRLRLGIGRPPGGMTTEDYVLSPFLPEERVALDKILETAREAVAVVVTTGASTAMNKYHGKAIN